MHAAGVSTSQTNASAKSPSPGAQHAALVTPGGNIVTVPMPQSMTASSSYTTPVITLVAIIVLIGVGAWGVWRWRRARNTQYYGLREAELGSFRRQVL